LVESRGTVTARVVFFPPGVYNVRHPQVGPTKPITFYLDETWIRWNCSPSKTWQYSDGLKGPLRKREGVIVYHVG
jgi:hypothetical protein